MKDRINQIFNQVFQFGINLKKSKSNYKDIFPVVGFFNNETKLEFEKIIKVQINEVSIFEQALIHRSYLQVVGEDKKFKSNERLEFLGDSILGMIIAEFLFFEHNNVLEGDLTKMRSWLVNKNSLGLCARELKIQKFVQMSFSAEKSVVSGNDSILADVMEAIIAAIYLDSGMDKARNFILHTLFPILRDQSVMQDTNYKSILLERVQGFGLPAPTYEVIEDIGPDHNKEFIIAAKVKNTLIGTGRGKSKKLAEQEAAKDALKVNIEEEFKHLIQL